MTPKANFLGMLTKSTSTSPFSLSAKKKITPPTAAGQSKPLSAPPTPGPTAPAPAPSPAKTQYINNVTSQYSPTQPAPSAPPAPAAPAAPAVQPVDPNAKYRSAMDAYIKSLSGSENNDIYDRFSSLTTSAKQGQDEYAKRLAELGEVGAGAMAGNLSTGTNVVGSGNAAIASQSVSQRAGALADAQQAKLTGAGFEADLLQSELDRRTAQDTAKSAGLKARADFEQGLSTPTEIGGKLIRQNPDTGAYEEVYAPEATPEGFSLSEGTSRYEFDPETGQYKEIASKAKTYAPKEGGYGATSLNGESPFIAQPNYSRLTAAQKKQADSLNNLVRTLSEYEAAMLSSTGGSGVNLFGADSGLLQTKLNSIIFAAAQAEGTGALQQADREVIEQIVPNPTNIKGAFNTITKGGKSGNIAKIQDQINKYTQNLAGYGLQPVTQSSPQAPQAPQANQPQSFQLPNGSVVTLQPDGTYK